MHVLLGMVILIYIAINAKKGRYIPLSKSNIGHIEISNSATQNTIAGFESGACYWHMVDLLWIILFPLIYVI